MLIAKGSNSHAKGMTINDLGVRPEEIEKKIFGGPSPGKKNFEKHSAGKNKFWEALCRKK